MFSYQWQQKLWKKPRLLRSFPPKSRLLSWTPQKNTCFRPQKTQKTPKNKTHKNNMSFLGPPKKRFLWPGDPTAADLQSASGLYQTCETQGRREWGHVNYWLLRMFFFFHVLFKKSWKQVEERRRSRVRKSKKKQFSEPKRLESVFLLRLSRAGAPIVCLHGHELGRATVLPFFSHQKLDHTRTPKGAMLFGGFLLHKTNQKAFLWVSWYD